MGRVDLHNHLLHGLDDGAVDLAESLAIARSLVAAGYTDVAATPHSRPDLDPTLAEATERRVALQQVLDREGIALRVHPGCENHLTPEFLERAARGEPRALGEAGRYVLVELPFASPVPNLRQTLFQLSLRGLRPLIAHPERCAQFVDRIDAVRELVDAGVHFQLEIASLTGIYGAAAKRCAKALLSEGLVSVVATDAHRPTSAQQILDQGLPALQKALGPTRLALLTEENPARVLRGEMLLAD